MNPKRETRDRRKWMALARRRGGWLTLGMAAASRNTRSRQTN